LGGFRYVVTYILKRLLLLIPVLLGVTIITSFMLYLIPGDAVGTMFGLDLPPEMLEILRQQVGLDQPPHVQYWRWLTHAIQGDFGISLRTQQPILPELLRRFSVTAQLTVVSVGLGLILSIPLGVFSAVRQGGAVDFVVRFIAMLGISLPNFAVGILFLLITSLYLKWAPPAGFISIFTDFGKGLQVLLLPSLTLGLAMAAVIMRMTRSAVLETLRLDYIRTARSKGLSQRRVLYGHALKPAFIPILTVIGMQIGYLLGGAVVVEEIFGLPGLGRLVLSSIYQRDYPLVQAGVLFIAGTFMLVNLVVDILYAYVDPRIRY
jgi:peptide/nickel transport system permease protein